MNRLDFVQTGGFPLKAERLAEMQAAYGLFNTLGLIAGNFSIITGCEVAGSNITDGVIVINGEVLPFQGGAPLANVIIIENQTSKEFENGSVKVVHYERYAKFGTAATQYAWNNFKRIFPTRDLQSALDAKATVTALTALTAKVTELEKKNAVFQDTGGVVLWMKPASQIPAGWAEYTPMRGRAPFGLDPTDPTFSTLGQMGGQKTKQLTISEMPPHTHPIKLWDEQGVGAPAGGSPGGITNGTGATESAGFGNEFSILNPHRIVYFIHYIGN
ncbi:hypothetical protein [Flavobacterium beibuense]|uniref:hypothetical protein n=1 Tax=Flavobacterium beibuense TaxID=657326 RepID=UPI003A951D52